MEKLTQLWNTLDGKKMVIGSLILATSFLATQINDQVLVGIWGIVAPLWFGKVIATLNWVGTAFTGVGAIHKSVKA